MKLILTLALFFLVTGCASSGYNPHYIVSDTLDEEVIPQQQELSDPTSF
jgi:hypothetical protein